MTEIHDINDLRHQLRELLHQQSETLKARVFGGVSDLELIEYDLREKLIEEIQVQLARSAA
jgi:hypothetical protein